MPNRDMQLTAEQRAALQRGDVSIALSAGAGCGKTFVLTERFLRELRPERRADPLTKIVAITFTERAAREMRDRIRQAVHNELNDCREEEVSHWLQILRGLDSARISTIHSFCATLLRSHAVEAGLDPRFGVLEAGLGETFLRRVVGETVYELLSAGDPDCMEFVLHYGLESTRQLLGELLQGRFSADFEQFASFTAEELADHWRQRWEREHLPWLLRELLDAPETIAVLRLLQQEEPLTAEMRRRRDVLLERLPQLPECADPQPLLEELHEAAKVQGSGGKKAWRDEAVYNDVKSALTALRKSLDKLRKQLEVGESDLQTAARFGIMGMRLTRRLAENYAAAKSDAALLDFDDLMLETRNLLRNSAAVRRRAASGIEFLMVDEFQDTDPVGAEIVRCLGGDELLDGKLFCVGDVKQSIYRFRRADPKVFRSLRETLPQRGRLPLTTNFRSQPAILNFVNSVFGPAMGADYEPLVPHQNEQVSPTPAIEFLWAIPAADEVGEKEKETAEERRQREAEWIARRIGRLLDDPTPCIRDNDPETGGERLRRVEQGDIVILFQALSNVGLYEEALRNFALSYYLVGGRAFYAQQEIYDIVDLCQCLDDWQDSVSLAGVLRSPMFGFSDDTLFALVEAAGSLQGGLQRPPEHLPDSQRRQVDYAAEVLAELRAKKDRLRLPALLNLALERTGYDAALLNEFLGRRKLANVAKLIEMARQFDRSSLFTLKDFVVRLRESVSEETHEELAPTHPETSNVIRLMTVHQAKGLEFPVVIVADMDRSPRGNTSAARFHPELGPLLKLPRQEGETPRHLGREMDRDVEQSEQAEETVRLLYVAMTRAADYLILSAGLAAVDTYRSPWLKLLADRYDLETGLPAGDPYWATTWQQSGLSCDELPAIHVHHKPPEAEDRELLSTGSPLPLGQFAQAVESAEPSALPPLFGPVTPASEGVAEWSVSQIERADADLHGGESGGISENDTPAAGESSAALGSLVHAVLERISFADGGNLEWLLETCRSQCDEIVDEATRQRVRHRLQTFLASPLAEELAAADRCFRELDFLLKWPPGDNEAVGATITGQIDCLYRTRTGTWILCDYKTGRLPESDAAAVEEYAVQLGVYSLAVQETFGWLPEQVELVGLGETVRRIPFTPEEPFLEDIIQRVEAAVGRLREKTAVPASSL